MLNDVFQIVYIIGLVVGYIIRIPPGRQHKRAAVVEKRVSSVQEKVLLFLASIGLLVLPLIYLFSPWLDFADYRLPVWAAHAAGWPGAAIFAAALWLLWRSHVDLGRHWSPMLQIRKKHALVTHGSFRYIRHPMYAAHWLWAVAQALLLQNWIAGPALLVTFFPVYWLRVPREEQMLLEHFGDAYRSYMNRTGRVIPRLGR